MIKAKIISDPTILNGKPIIAGTRISVELIMNFLSSGMSVDDIKTEYPTLKRNEILTAVDYAKKLVSKQKTQRPSGDQISITLHEITR